MAPLLFDKLQGSTERALWKRQEREVMPGAQDHIQIPSLPRQLRSLRTMPREEADRLIDTHLSALPERQRLALGLRIREALDVADIARVLGAREETVSELIEEAIEALGRRLADARALQEGDSVTETKTKGRDGRPRRKR